MNKKVFLGGTCEKSETGKTYRDFLIPQIGIDYFNPVVDDWNEEAYQRELLERENDDFCLYLITPQMTGVYSIAEVVDDSNKRPEKTIFCFLHSFEEKSFQPHQVKALDKVGVMVENNGGMYAKTWDQLVRYLNMNRV